MKDLSTLIQSVPASPTTMMMQKGREKQAAGYDVVNLAGGEPDFDTPDHIVEAGFAAIRAGDTHYPPPLWHASLAGSDQCEASQGKQYPGHQARTDHGDTGGEMGTLCLGRGHDQSR